MMWKAIISGLISISLVLFATCALAQDAGVRDTLKIGSVQVDDVSTEVTVDIPIHLTWDDVNVLSIQVPIWIKSDYADLDTAILDPFFTTGMSFSGFVRHPNEGGEPSNKGNIFARLFAGTYPCDSTEKTFAKVRVTIPAGTPAHCITLDASSLENPDRSLLLVDHFGESWVPLVIPGRIDILDGCSICDCLAIGDFNDDGQINPVDVVYLIDYAFRNGPSPPADLTCPVLNRGDFNCDGRIDLSDVVGIAGYVYRFPAPGPCDPCPD